MGESSSLRSAWLYKGGGKTNGICSRKLAVPAFAFPYPRPNVLGASLASSDVSPGGFVQHWCMV